VVLVERQQQASSEIPVNEPLLQSLLGVRIDRGGYMIGIGLGADEALERLFVRHRGASLVLDLPGKEQR